MRALIVDDEIHAREELEALLAETGAFTVVGKCANALEALQAIRRDKPEVLFLDIQMPMINGLELLGMIDEDIMPTVVFVTAYDQYALKAFEENALDYLLKPVEKERLAKTVQRLKRILKEGERPSPVQGIIPALTKIPCILSNRIKLISLSEVEYVKSDLAGIYVVTANGQYFTELTLRVLEDRTHFIRCHKQFLVNIDHVDEILIGENLQAQISTKSGHCVPVSRRHFKKLKDRLGL
ncbi:MAG: two-component system response regulator BtsR [Desulfobacteraceae bacterium]|nr:two-component system response regulator BtsR [Desulfobacteraceae bacterium]